MDSRSAIWKITIGVVISLLVIISPAAAATSGSREVPFTQDDRDRIIRLEVQLAEGQRSLQKQIDDLKADFHDLKADFNGLRSDFNGLRADIQGQIRDVRNLIYVVLAGMFTLVGFVLWDRRTALAPVIRQQRDLAGQAEHLERVLREYAKVEPRLAEILRSISPSRF